MIVLTVDDCQLTQRLIKDVLQENSGIEIRQAFSGEECLEKLSEDIDLILLDITMPGKDGLEICNIIKQKQNYEDVPVMIITQNDDVVTLERAFSVGASDYICKPFNEVELRVRVRSLLQLCKEMKKRKAREEELMMQTMVDGLTGIANRRFLDHMIHREWKLALRNQQPLSIILFDVDYFKLYNDNFGHLAGDEVLKALAITAKKQLKRSSDIIARYGGEEFVVVLPNTPASGAYLVAEDIRKSIEELKIPHLYSLASNKITVSLGIAEYKKCLDGSPDILISEADKALYLAKKQGRNQVVYIYETY
ncbi:GGDEF domain-containing response regulator [Desulfuribacillus alkaliarsenatis]|uniref:Diguanylate cyclase response regulator n=1 Tax=Desulfuribacillus alkaliarsenatis TaxID=766136 RepID=A0A1E5G2H7_9FIRM|nr:diguanylate cyclase [Desulfuribacillus alkaliarsenatis]OEF96741.1 hypothetical protein BHF68_06620 [Desulfuribacillus alkaliarsenatis]